MTSASAVSCSDLFTVNAASRAMPMWPRVVDTHAFGWADGSQPAQMDRTGETVRVQSTTSATVGSTLIDLGMVDIGKHAREGRALSSDPPPSLIRVRQGASLLLRALRHRIELKFAKERQTYLGRVLQEIEGTGLS